MCRGKISWSPEGKQKLLANTRKREAYFPEEALENAKLTRGEQLEAASQHKILIGRTHPEKFVVEIPSKRREAL